MEFANPKILWLLAVVPLIVAYYIWRATQGGASIVISTTDSLRKAPRTFRYYLRHLPIALRAVALTLIIVASARPQSVEHETKINTEGIDIVLAVDISGSMLARDFQPDRLTAAKEVAAQFVPLFVICESHSAVGTAGAPAARGALDVGGKPSAVLKEHNL